MPRGRLFQPLEIAAFKLKPNEISKPVESNTGVQLIKLYERRPQGFIPPYDEIRELVEKAAKTTLQQPLLEVDYANATGALIHITGGEDMTLGEANAIGELITQKLKPDASVTWGARIDPKIHDRIEVIAVITGVKSPHVVGGTSYGDTSGSFLYTEEFYKWDKGLREV